MIIKLKVKYLIIAFIGISSLNLMGMEREESTKSLTEICCQSIGDCLSKSSNLEEIAEWIASRDLPEELEKSLKKYIIKSNINKIKLYFKESLILKGTLGYSTGLQLSSLRCVINSDCTLYIYDAKKRQCAEIPNCGEIYISKDNFILIYSNEILIFCLDSKSGLFRQANIEEIAKLIKQNA